MNLKNAKELIKTTFRRQVETGVRFSIELESGPGLGKSESCLQCANELEQEWGEPVAFLSEFLSTREPPDVAGFGIPSKDTEGKAIMTRTRAPWMPKPGDPKYGILLLDEFRQANHDVQKPAAELLLNGRVGESELPITYLVLAASNREKDRSGVQRELAFISNRRMLIKIEPSLDAWVEWAEGPGNVHPLAIAFCKTKPGVVFADSIPDKTGPFCTPRTLVRVSHLIGALDMALFTEAAAGYIGEGAAAELVSFLRVAEQLPSFEDIVAAPLKAPVPDRSDASYAAMQMIAHRVDEKTAIPAMQYLKRMGKEFQVAGLRSTIRRTAALMNTPEFINWMKENKEIVVSANLLDRKKK